MNSTIKGKYSLTQLAADHRIAAEQAVPVLSPFLTAAK